MPDHKMVEWTDDAINRFWTFTNFSPEEYFTFAFGKAIVQSMSAFLLPGRRVLDYGCGIGCLVEHLIKKSLVVTAADNSPTAVETVKRKYEGTPRFGGAYGIEDLLQRNESFDVVIAVEVIEHLNDDKLESFVMNAKRLLAPKGILIVTTPNNEQLAKQYVYCPNCEHVFHRVQHVRSWSESSLQSYFEKSEFVNVSTYATDFSIMNLSFYGRLVRAVKRIGGQRLPEEHPHLVGVFSPRM